MDAVEFAKLIARNVCDLRVQRGRKWKQFESDTGVYHSAVTNWKNGKVPKVDQLYKICNAYDVSLDWLVGKSKSQRIANSPLTYSDWICTLESWLDTGVIKNFYLPELDDISDKLEAAYDEIFELWDLTKSANQKKFPGSISQKSDNQPDTHISKIADSSTWSFSKPSSPFDIYNIVDDFHGTYPDIFAIKDTFLRCILAKLSYYKRVKTGEEYEAMKDSILKKYGDKDVLKLDVYALFDTSHCRNIFEKYNGVEELNLEEVWQKLNEIKKLGVKEWDLKEAEETLQKYNKIRNTIISTLTDEP